MDPLAHPKLKGTAYLAAASIRPYASACERPRGFSR
jgi:hypothetical protein